MKSIMKSKFYMGLVTGIVLFLQSAVSLAVPTSFTINQTFSQGGSHFDDIPETSIALGGAGSFVLDPGFSGLFFDVKIPGTGTFSTISTELDGYYFLRSYSSGETIGSGNFGTHLSQQDDWDTILVSSQTAGVWGSSHDGFLGFLSSSDSYGWIDYSYTRSSGVSTLSLFNGAYESTTKTSIVAGGAGAPVSVPEPASFALLGLGLAGIGFTRRKKIS